MAGQWRGGPTALRPLRQPIQIFELGEGFTTSGGIARVIGSANAIQCSLPEHASFAFGILNCCGCRLSAKLRTDCLRSAGAVEAARVVSTDLRFDLSDL